MKKFLILIVVAVFSIGQSKSQTIKNEFIEWNTGIASFEDYIIPGISVLFGRTSRIGNNGIFEWQFGGALPSLITGKLIWGKGKIDKYIGISIRPWPFFVGPQIKLNKFSFSFEFGTNKPFSFYTTMIGTVGYRWKIKN